MHVPADDVEDPTLPYYPSEPRATDSFATRKADARPGPFFLGCIGVTLFATGIGLGATFITHQNVAAFVREANAQDRSLERVLRLSEVRQHNSMLSICDSLDALYKKYPQPRSGEDLVP